MSRQFTRTKGSSVTSRRTQHVLIATALSTSMAGLSVWSWNFLSMPSTTEVESRVALPHSKPATPFVEMPALASVERREDTPTVVREKQPRELSTNDDVVGEIETLAQFVAETGPGSSEIREQMPLLVELLRKDPQATASVMETLQAQNDAKLACYLVSALAKSGTEASQSGLESMLTDGKWSQPYRELALDALGQIESPPADLEGAVMAFHAADRSGRASALAVLGRIGHNVRRSDPSRADAIQDQLREFLRSGSGPEIAMALYGLAAMRPQKLLPELEVGLGASNEKLRMLATKALRKTQGLAASNRLVEVLQNDESAAVRSEALDGIRTLGAGGLEILHRVLEADSSDRVRQKALRYFATAARDAGEEKRSEVKATIARMARADDSNLIRREAQQLLDRLNESRES